MAVIGEAVTFSCLFLNSSGSAANPTTVKLTVREEVDGTELYWDIIPTTPAGMNAISANPGAVTGYYTMRFVCRKPERVTGHWTGAGNSVNQGKQETFFVRHSPVTDVEP